MKYKNYFNKTFTSINTKLKKVNYYLNYFHEIYEMNDYYAKNKNIIKNFIIISAQRKSALFVNL